MKKIFCFCISAVLLAGTFCGCTQKNAKSSSPQPTTEAVTEEVTSTKASSENTDNSAAPFLGKWETYKVSVNGEEYETAYAGYPISSVAKLVI